MTTFNRSFSSHRSFIGRVILWHPEYGMQKDCSLRTDSIMDINEVLEIFIYIKFCLQLSITVDHPSQPVRLLESTVPFLRLSFTRCSLFTAFSDGSYFNVYFPLFYVILKMAKIYYRFIQSMGSLNVHGKSRFYSAFYESCSLHRAIMYSYAAPGFNLSTHEEMSTARTYLQLTQIYMKFTVRYFCSWLNFLRKDL